MKSIFFVFTFITLSIAQAGSNDLNDKGRLSRRGFLGVLLGGATAAAMNPMSILGSSLEGLRIGLPAALKKHIVSVRLKTISVVGETAGQVTDPLLGLRNYIKFLEDLALDPINVEYNAAILNKVKAARQSLVVFEQAYLKNPLGQNQLDKPQDLIQKDSLNTKSLSEKGESEELRSVFAESLQDLPMDIRIITIRTLLGPEFLRKMAWQVHFSNLKTIHPTLILTDNEFQIIKDYYTYLYEASVALNYEKINLNNKGMSLESLGSFSELFLNQLMLEASEVIEAFNLAQNFYIESSVSKKDHKFCFEYLNF